MRSTFAIVLIFCGSVICFAEPIQFIHEGEGSGTLDGIPFPSIPFVITATGDTANRFFNGSAYWIEHDSAQIALSGLGTFDFLVGTRTFVNPSLGLVGFSRAGSFGADLFNGPSDPGFTAWEMLTPIGPISLGGQLIQWDPVAHGAVTTSGGVLEFINAPTPATFTARLIPEPSSIMLTAGPLFVFALLSMRCSICSNQ